MNRFPLVACVTLSQKIQSGSSGVLRREAFYFRCWVGYGAVRDYHLSGALNVPLHNIGKRISRTDIVNLFPRNGCLMSEGQKRTCRIRVRRANF